MGWIAPAAQAASGSSSLPFGPGGVCPSASSFVNSVWQVGARDTGFNFKVSLFIKRIPCLAKRYPPPPVPPVSV